VKRFHLKSIAVSLAVVSSFLVLAGCGKQSSASLTTGTPTAASTADTQKTSDPNLMTSEQQVKSIDIKATKGQQEVNVQINKNLNNLDKSLNTLNESLGSL
jgi:ABC-type oligopeptide transport system substrate-binding subunit